MTIAVTTSAVFTATYVLNRLDGVKDLDPQLRKPRELMTEEELWKKILEEPYEKPHCPHCHSELNILRIDVDLCPSTIPIYHFGTNQTVSSTYYFPDNPRVWMYCENCNITLLGEGRGLEFKGEKVFLQKLRLISTRPNLDSNCKLPIYYNYNSTSSINWTMTFT